MLDDCCSPSFPPRRAGSAPTTAMKGVGPASLKAASVLVQGGICHVGTNQPLFPRDGEAPRRPIILKSFRLAPMATTVAEFGAFVASTGYVTDAERLGSSFVFRDQVHPETEADDVPGLQWWKDVKGASWKNPSGAAADPEPPADHPVTHVSWNDAVAYATWAGGRLPSEAEWEHAARGLLVDPVYPWGDTPPDDETFFPCNIWQGRFPSDNTGADGHLGLAPALSFAPNGLGLYNMCGNSWEWTADRPDRERERSFEDARVLKGGSFLCHASYCHRYRIAARMARPTHTTTGHMGFRIAFSV